MCSKKYFLDTDNSSHWYLIPMENEKEWNKWVNLDEDDEKSWDAPLFAKRINGPQSIIFENPISVV